MLNLVSDVVFYKDLSGLDLPFCPSQIPEIEIQASTCCFGLTTHLLLQSYFSGVSRCCLALGAVAKDGVCDKEQDCA